MTNDEELVSLRMENSRLRDLFGQHEADRDMKDFYERLLTDIGKMVGCGHIDDKLPSCVADVLNGKRKQGKLKDGTDAPSDLFMGVFCNGGTPSIECGFCGRIHFTHEDDDVESLREKQKAEPNKYIESANDSIGFGYLDGKQLVDGCPCNAAFRYESFIWSYRERIATYLRKRATNQIDEAQLTLDALGEPDAKPTRRIIVD